MPETRNLEISDYSIEVSCDECRENADVCLCQADYDKRLEDEYERGKADGREEEIERLAQEQLDKPDVE